MDRATDKTVLGDFSNAGFDYNGVHSRFFRDGDKFMVETDGPNGKLAASFEIKYTFGVDPLQQYLIEFPDTAVFRRSSIAWVRGRRTPAASAGSTSTPTKRSRHDDVLHWTKLNQNWNFMCAECHSTGVARNYNAANDTYATRFAEIGVGCEACHGEGSRHVAWARAQQTWWPFGKPQNPTKGLHLVFSTKTQTSPGCPAHRQTAAADRSSDPAQGGRDLRALPCPARSIFRGMDAGPLALRYSPCCAGLA